MKILNLTVCGCHAGTLAASVLLLIGVSACHVTQPTEPRAGTAPSPVKLTLVVNDVYCKDSACSCVHFIATRRYADFFRLLKERYNIQVTPVYLEDSFQTARQIKSGQVDGAICKPWLGHQSAQASGRHYRRAADLQDVFTNTVLRGLFIVLAESPIRTLKDAANKRIVFGKADAFEKHDAAFAALEKAGLALPPSSSRLEKSSCIEAIGALMDKSAEVAVISHYALTGGCAVDIAKPEDFRVVAETEPLPFISLMLDQDKISKADFSRIREAFIALSHEALPSTMSGGGFVEPLPWSLVDRP
jgi:ABC-type phosphate/phosphonate transport system substrate-binding protein